MINKIIYVACLVLSLAATSCTISEEPVESLPAKNYLLKSLKVGGIVSIVNYEYDSRNRMIKCNLDQDEIFTMTYEGNSTVPSTIVSEFYSYYYPDNSDRQERYLCERLVITVTKSNSQGFITNYKGLEEGWHETYKVVNGEHVTVIEHSYTDTWTATMEYDSEGHFIYLHDSDDEWTRLTWKNGLLTELRSDDGSYCKFEYCDANNVANQWDPMVPIWGPYQIANWFGNAPSKLLKGYSYHFEDDEDENVEISYRLQSNGLINAARYNAFGDGMSIITYNYQAIR